MQALESLQQDHRVLNVLSDALDAYVEALESGRRLWRGDLAQIVHGFRTLADHRHFEKEDEVLVPLLVRNGFDYRLAILDGTRQEHDGLRYLIRVLEQAAEREPRWGLHERLRIAGTSRHLVARQRRLAAAQERELFPRMLERLKPAALGQLAEQLRSFDAARAARGLVLDAAALRRSLLARYRVSPPSARELSR